MTFSAIFPKPGFDTNKVKVVRDNQTVQQVLDSITDASETNKYLVLVPSGHELEYFDWKPNVEVKFLDNLDERWKLDELEGWDDLSNWTIGTAFTASIETIQGQNFLKLSVDDVNGSKNISFNGNFDLRKYQGISLTIKSSSASLNSYIIDINGNFIESVYLRASWETYIDCFIPFNFDKNEGAYCNNIDWENINKFSFYVDTSNNVDILIGSLKLVRTFPYPCLFLRTDDSSLGSAFNRVVVLEELERRKIPVIWAIIAGRIGWNESYSMLYPKPELLRRLQNRGYISVVNHSYNHPNFFDIRDNEKDTLFQIESSRFIFERLGLKDALNWWVNPYGSANGYLIQQLKEYGYKSVYPEYEQVPLCITDQNGFNDKTYITKKGGIATLLFHLTEIDTDEKIEMFLNNIDNILQTHRPISIRDIERLMNNSHEKFSPRQTKPTLFQVLDSDFDMYFYHKQLFLDPNGTDRNINVQPYELRPGDPALIVNTGSTGNLIFDPSGLNLTIQPGQSANVIYDGDQWRQI